MNLSDSLVRVRLVVCLTALGVLEQGQNNLRLVVVFVVQCWCLFLFLFFVWWRVFLSFCNAVVIINIDQKLIKIRIVLAIYKIVDLQRVVMPAYRQDIPS